MTIKLQAKFIGSLLSFLTLFLFTICNAQVSNYQFFQLSGTYTPITGGTLINDGILSQSRQFDDEEIENIPLGFTFIYNGANYSTVNLSSNGFLTFNPIVTTYSPISSSAPNRVISAMGADLASGINIMGNVTQSSNLITDVVSANGLSIGQAISQTANNVFNPGTTITDISGSGPFTLTMSALANADASNEFIEFNFDSQVPGENPSELRYQTIGVAPNRTFVAQYTRLTRYGFFYDNLNFQIRLNENGSIEFVYGDFSWNSSLQNTAQVGIKGNTNNDFNNRRGTNWNATTAGITRTSFVVAGANNVPPISGTTFRWATCSSATIEVSPTTDTLCAGQSSSLTASGAVSYSWTPQTGLNTSTGANVIASPTINTTYFVTGTDVNGCVSTALVPIIVNVLPSLSVNDATICSGNNAALSVTPSNLTYSWSNGESTSSINVSPSSTSIFTVTVTDENGCSASAFGTVTVDTTTLSNTEVAVCNNQLPYNWNGNDYNAAGNYEVTLSGANGCDSIATLILTVSNTGSSTTNVAVCNNQLPYNWNGNDYNAAGNYEVTLSGANGCDSIATLILTVSNTGSSTTNVAVCNNQLPYNWNGNDYNAAGSYEVTLSGANGCDSIATLILTVNNTGSSTTNVAVCNNQLPYNWNGNDYNAAGNYEVTLSGANGCDSIATLILTVNNTGSSTTNVAVCNNQLPYNWNGNDYNAAGNYEVTLSGANGCDSIATLILTVNNTGSSTTNVAVCNNQLPYNWNGNDYNAAGNYEVTLSGANGCDSIATLILTVNNTGSSTTNVAVCNNQLPYNWNGNDYNAAGNYEVTLSGANGCDSIATLILTVNNTGSSTTNVAVCNNQLPYNWNGNDYNAAGNYEVTLSGANGCDSIATLILTVNNTGSSITNVAVCNNQLPYNWNGNDYNAAGNYEVTLSGANGCDSIATLILTVNNTGSSTTNVAVCNNQLPYNWNGNDYNAAGNYEVTLSGANGCDSIATLILTVNNTGSSTTNVAVCNNQLPYNWNGNDYNAAGNYEVTLSGANGCDSIATLILTVNNTGSSTTNVAVCNNQLPYNWNGNDYNAAGNYEVTLSGANGCDSIATLILTVNNTGSSTTNVAVCNNQLPYNWNGNDYNAAGNYEVTLSGANGCDSIATLILTVNNTGSSTTNVAVCNNQLPYNWNGNDYNAAGNYEVTLSGANGCDSIATLILSVNTPPVLTSISGSTSVCPATASTYSINQVDGATYNWTYSSNWLTNSGVSTNTINVTVVDTSFLTVTATNSCGTSNPVTIFVNSQCPLPTGVGTTSVNSTSATITWNSAICSQQYTVQIKQVGTGIWTSFDAGANTTYTFTGLNPLKNYQYKVINICSTLPGTPILYGPVYSFSTPAANGCTLPQNLAVTNISASSAKINWNTQTTFRFRLRVRPVGTTTWTSYTITGSQNSIILTNLNSSTEYEYQMRAECSLGVFSGFTGRKKFTTLAGRLDETEDHTGYNLYPNPVLDRLNIAAPFSDDTYYDVYISNTLGQVMLTLQALRGSNQSVDLTSLPAGVYIVNIKEAEEIRSYKIVKQ